MLRYEQATGRLFDEHGALLGAGHAGRNFNGINGWNNPSEQSVKSIGPLPVGFYTMQPPADDPVVGKYAMRLIPDPDNNMYGRNSFFMHGDSAEDPALDSHGCVVQNRTVRQIAWQDNPDHRIQVVTG